ncbi:MAG: DegT/DnrJ/EryC1/StrS family aminotransferase [Bacteroidales bacterium]|nr:DegT/DnrJ/EryC1/StrS family aminotransferase [Bacteroidales bacterium]
MIMNYPDKEIRMVDLHGQYLRIKGEIDTAIQLLIDSTEFVKGSNVKRFEENLQKYMNVKHVIACGNGTDALQIALMALYLNEGDEIITSPFTFIATVEVIAILKLKPVFADVDPETFNINTKVIEQKITNRTKAILPVHLFGQCSNMEEIMSIARKHNLFVIEDNAQAIGADYYFTDGVVQKAGTIGDIGCTSFFPSKNLGAFGDGGAMMTNNDELAHKMRTIANHGMERRYYHDYIGVNSRLDGLQAAILNVKLKYLDDYIKSRQAAAAFYDNAFQSVDSLAIPGRINYSSHVFHQYTLKIDQSKREKLQNYLQSKKIPAMIYYPVPLHLQRAFQHLGYKEGDFPVSELLARQVLSLPMHTELTRDQLQYITDTIKSLLDGK